MSVSEWEKEKAGLVGDLSKANAREQKLLKVIERHLGESEATRAIQVAGGSAVLLLPHVMQEIRVVEDGDDFKTIVVAKDGKMPRIKDGSGNPMTIDDLVAEFKTRPIFGDAFGADASSSSAEGGNTHKISAAAAKDNRRYVAAKDAAAKAGAELEIVDDVPVKGSPGAHTISAAAAKDNRRYVAAKEAAERAGVPLETV